MKITAKYINIAVLCVSDILTTFWFQIAAQITFADFVLELWQRKRRQHQNMLLDVHTA
jgi:hypothetical protein